MYVNHNLPIHPTTPGEALVWRISTTFFSRAQIKRYPSRIEHWPETLLIGQCLGLNVLNTSVPSRVGEMVYFILVYHEKDLREMSEAHLISERQQRLVA